MTGNKRVGFTASTFDLFHAGHVTMLQEARNVCDYLIAAIQVDPTIDRPSKNKPVQSIVERQIQVAACRYVDQIIVYTTEAELEELLRVLPIDVRILGDEYANKWFTGRDICDRLGIELYFNSRNHEYSSTRLRERIEHASYYPAESVIGE